MQKNSDNERKSTTGSTTTSMVITGKNFWEMACKYVSQMRLVTDLPTISPGSVGWDEWEQYFFFFLECDPWMLKQVREGLRDKMTVPEQFPSLFDPRFVYDGSRSKHVHKRQQSLPRHLRESYEDLQKRYGFNWGIDEGLVDRKAPRRGSEATEGRRLYEEAVRASRESSAGGAPEDP